MAFSDNLQHKPINRSTLQNADWAALQLLNHYRLFLLIAFAAVFYVSGNSTLIGQLDPMLFVAIHSVYLIVALVFSFSIKLRRPKLETQFYLQAYVDIIALSVMMHASGGIQSGLSPLLVVLIAVVTHCTRPRYAMLFAAIATATILSQELYTKFAYGADHANLPQTGLVGLALFFVATLTSIVLPARQQARPDESRPLSVRQITELNRQIIQELESGVIYVDSDDHIQIANETCRDMLLMEGLDLPVHLGLACEPLYKALRLWKRQPTAGNRPISTQIGTGEILPCFTPLENGGTLIKIEDHRLIKQQVQQLKLASLGRLSASIAHEIRNPLGVISNAVQLVAESGELNKEDARLIDIAESNTRRINRIVEDVLQLSTRQTTATENISAIAHFEAFKHQFCDQTGFADAAVKIEVDANVQLAFDAVHLDQILWNLCNNSLVHNQTEYGDTSADLEISLVCLQSDTQSVLIEINDNGRGIDINEQPNLFEPFFTTRHGGSGLGLYIIRELCELNHASIAYIDPGQGTCFRIFAPTAQAMTA